MEGLQELEFVPCILGSHQTEKPWLASLQSLPQALVFPVSTRIITHEPDIKVVLMSDFEGTKHNVDSISGLDPASETR